MAPKKKAAPKENPTIPKRAKTHRTQTDPWEASRDETYEIKEVVNFRIHKAQRQYLIKWCGRDPRGKEWEDTWEPMENLIGCAAQIRDYEKAREAQDKADKEAVLAKKRERQQEKEEEAKRLKAAALSNAADDISG